MVDGRQRFEAIFGFMRGEFALDETPVPALGLRSAAEAPSLVLAGATMRDLMMRHPELAFRRPAKWCVGSAVSVNRRNGYRAREFDTLEKARSSCRSRSCGKAPTSPNGRWSGASAPSGR